MPQYEAINTQLMVQFIHSDFRILKSIIAWPYNRWEILPNGQNIQIDRYILFRFEWIFQSINWNFNRKILMWALLNLIKSLTNYAIQNLLFIFLLFRLLSLPLLHKSRKLLVIHSWNKASVNERKCRESTKIEKKHTQANSNTIPTNQNPSKNCICKSVNLYPLRVHQVSMKIKLSVCSSLCGAFESALWNTTLDLNCARLKTCAGKAYAIVGGENTEKKSQKCITVQ